MSNFSTGAARGQLPSGGVASLGAGGGAAAAVFAAFGGGAGSERGSLATGQWGADASSVAGWGSSQGARAGSRGPGKLACRAVCLTPAAGGPYHLPAHAHLHLPSTASLAGAAPNGASGLPQLALPGLGAPELPRLEGLRGLAGALAVVEAALSVGQHLPQMLLYRWVGAQWNWPASCRLCANRLAL
jgi:hypothetical protein